MRTQADQKEYLASIAQGFDVGDFDYLPPQAMQSLNSLIADAWKAFKDGADINAQIDDIEQFIKSKRSGA